MNRGLQIGLPFDAPPEVVPVPTDVLAPIRNAFAPTRIDVVPSPIEPVSTTITLAPLYFVRHRRARRYLLRVEPDGRLRVTIPRGGSKRDAEAFAARNAPWVAGQRAGLTQSTIAADDRARLRARAEEELPPRLRELAAEHGVTGLTRVSIRGQRTRWGSCGHNGHITLNWRLLLMPPSVRDYVLIHELMHLRRMDHSPAYWRLVASACPTYAESRVWLRLHGRTLR